MPPFAAPNMAFCPAKGGILPGKTSPFCTAFGWNKKERPLQYHIAETQTNKPYKSI